jgi:hypothetical protein
MPRLVIIKPSPVQILPQLPLLLSSAIEHGTTSVSLPQHATHLICNVLPPFSSVSSFTEVPGEEISFPIVVLLVRVDREVLSKC